MNTFIEYVKTKKNGEFELDDWPEFVKKHELESKILGKPSKFMVVYAAKRW